jgi:hypothetical protein
MMRDMKRFFCLLAAVTVFAVTMLAADASGTWTGQMPTRDGDTRDVTFKLKQDGAGLTGTMSAFDNDIPIQEGKADGDKVTFTVTLDFNGNSFKISFNGTVKGDQIEMTREREGSGNKQNFTLKRSS